MRIGMLTDAYKPHVSGITNYIGINRTALEDLGHEVFVFTFGDVPDDQREPGVYRTPGLPLLKTGYHFSASHAPAVRKQIQSMDVLHVHHPFMSGRLALRYGRPAGIPIVFTNHTRYDLYAQHYLPAVPDPVTAGLLGAYMPMFCQEIDLTIAPSEGLRRVLLDQGVKAPVVVIPNGVNLSQFSGGNHPAQRGMLGVAENATLLVYAGRLGPEKNLPFLLKAFAGVHSALPSATLLLVGDGPERPQLQQLTERLGIQQAVIFAGMVPYAEVPGYLLAADVFVSASVTEVHPLSVIEGMASGLPVVGIRSPGLSDMIEEGVNGLLSAEDMAEFAAKLTLLAGDATLRRRMAEGARQSSRKYDVRLTAPLVLQAYEQLLQQPRRRRNPAWRNFVARLRRSA
jgi:1,2-diacylglycerol 3-alpha-glucosyltransferase